jgi:hypothetical protein
MLAWDNKYVRRRLRIDIPKRNDFIGLVDNVGRNVAVYDFAEQTVW